MIKQVEIDFNFQPYIQRPPESPSELYKRACSADEITINSWRDIWKKQIKENHDTYGPFAKNPIGSIYGSQRLKPCIIVGSGPSLAGNVDVLKDTKGIPVVSVLHNYHYLEDRGIKPDYYVSLDAGRITLEEISEGGKKTLEEYIESTKDKTLLAFIGSHPDLIKSWKGKVLWFSAPIPDAGIIKYIDDIEDFKQFVSTGGNVLGACFYIAKAILCANPIVFVGADFCFSYTNQFHPWPSKYDAHLGHYITAVDVFGMPRKTWTSYANFKSWFESRVCSVPGIYINATEGGLLGAYPGGNIEQIRQMSLQDVVNMYSLSDQMGEDFMEGEIQKTIARVNSEEAKERREKIKVLEEQMKQIREELSRDGQTSERKILL